MQPRIPTMNQYEAAYEIVTIIPESNNEISKAMGKKNPFAIVRIFTRHIQKLVESHNEVMVRRCLKIMDKIYDKGDVLLKHAVENVFVYSFDTVMSTCDRTERKMIMGIMPMGLYTAYINQIYKSGI